MITLMFGATYFEEINLPSFGHFKNVSSDIRLSLECAAWRLERGVEWLCCSSSDTGEDSPMEHGVSKIKGQSVINVEFTAMLDLSLFFTGGLTFRIFCDQDAEDNYAVKLGAETFIVGPQARISCEVSDDTGK